MVSGYSASKPVDNRVLPYTLPPILSTPTPTPTPTPEPGDPFFDNVVLLLPFNGTNGSTTFTDVSNNAFVPTVVGGAQISTAQSKWGGASGVFNGTDAYLSFASSPELSLGTRGTIEAWVWFNSTADQQIISNYDDTGGGPYEKGYAISLNAGVIKVNLSGNVYDIVGTTTIVTNVFYHIAISGKQGSWKLFVNGVQEGSTFTGAVDLSSAKATTIGAFVAFGTVYERLNGYIDDLRITAGIARYTANFTPPDEPFPTSTGAAAGSGAANNFFDLYYF